MVILKALLKQKKETLTAWDKYVVLEISPEVEKDGLTLKEAKKIKNVLRSAIDCLIKEDEDNVN